MLENILQTRCMVLVCIDLQMDIDMKGLGMKEEDKVVVCILSEMVRLNQVNGIMELSVFRLLKIHFFHLFLMPKSLKQSR